MKVPIEVEIPDGALLSEWIAVLHYLPPEGELSSMSIDCSPTINSIQRIGMLVQASDYQRKVEVDGWHD